MKFYRSLVLNATLLGAFLLPATVLPCFGQQEVDPTWYDPWAPSRPVVTSPSTRTNVSRDATQKVTVTPTSRRNKKQVRRVATRRTQR